MFRLLLLIIIVVPTIEITVLIVSGKVIGIWPTLLLIIFTGVLGAWLANKEGRQAIRLAQIQTQQGQLPSGAILDGICVFVGGILLLTPGFITDIFGFILLLPWTRSIVKALILKIFHRAIKNGGFVIIPRK